MPDDDLDHAAVDHHDVDDIVDVEHVVIQLHDHRLDEHDDHHVDDATDHHQHQLGDVDHPALRDERIEHHVVVDHDHDGGSRRGDRLGLGR